MTRVTSNLVLLLLLVVVSNCSLASKSENYVEDACSVTRYRDVCLRSLSPFANTAKDNPSRWARAGVSVTIAEAKKAVRFLTKLKRDRKGNIRGRNKIAVSDCLESFQDTLDNLHKSLGVLRKLSFVEFNTQMGDVTTWVSAALTDEDTCLDGFNEGNGKVGMKSLVNHVSKVSHMTSNALALVNKLATTGP